MSIESSSPDRLPTAETILRDLGQSGATGVLEINHPADEMSHVWVRGGRIYAMQVPGYRPALGIRLLSGGLVSPEQLSAAAAEQRERFPGHLIGQVLVGMGYVDAQVIDAFVRDQVRDQVADLLDLEVVSAEFHEGRHVRQDIIEPTDIDQLLAVARANRDRRAEVLERVGGAHVTPVLGPPGTGPAQTPLGPYDWALLCRVDGRRDLTELARVCGFTVVEAAQVVADLAMTGLLAIPEPPPADESTLAPVVALHPPTEPEDPQWRFDGTDAGEPVPIAATATLEAPERSPELLAEFGALLRDDPAPVEQAPEPVTASGGDAGPPESAAPAEPPAPTLALVEPPAEPALALVPTGPPSPLTLVDGSPPPALTVVDAPTGPTADDAPDEGARGDAATDTTAFMRELSSLNDDPDKAEPVVTRLVVPLTEHRRKRRPWSR
ncbi:MAG: hypothetical protein MUF09_04475 [Candidatus Nanopelagicales bacterium]|jgi:hypothetical protein|nr:hypothetical protein [Candidatus Nanopelagicales bacterium]